MIVSKMQVNKKDMAVINMAMAVTEKVASKFLFTDISESNLSCLAGEATRAFRQAIGERYFVDIATMKTYKFKYISVHVDNMEQDITLVPKFEEVEV